VAAAATYFAGRISSRPADRNHRYGHGKVEDLSALFETVLLLATCVWIAYAAIHRMLNGGVEVEVTVWSFLVMLTSIVIDWSRSRALYRVARETNSKASSTFQRYEMRIDQSGVPSKLTGIRYSQGNRQRKSPPDCDINRTAVLQATAGEIDSDSRRRR
jgi:hypothetical protein